MSDFERRGKAEDEYFHRRDRELLEESRRARAQADERAALAAALGIEEGELVQGIQALGFTPDTLWLLEWLPAIQIGWVKGLERAERNWLLDRVRAQRGGIDAAADARLQGWLTTRPDDSLFDATRRALRARLTALPPEPRDALRESVLESARGISAASGGVLGIGSVSADERAALDALASDLATPA